MRGRLIAYNQNKVLFTTPDNSPAPFGYSVPFFLIACFLFMLSIHLVP